jgi:hypothetical protein
MFWACRTHGEDEETYKLLVSKPIGKRPLVRRRCRWEDNIKMDLKETWCEVADWLHLA